MGTQNLVIGVARLVKMLNHKELLIKAERPFILQQRTCLHYGLLPPFS